MEAVGKAVTEKVPLMSELERSNGVGHAESEGRVRQA